MDEGLHKKVYTILTMPESEEMICYQKYHKHGLSVSRQRESKSGFVNKVNLRDLMSATGLVIMLK